MRLPRRVTVRLRVSVRVRVSVSVRVRVRVKVGIRICCKREDRDNVDRRVKDEKMKR